MRLLAVILFFLALGFAQSQQHLDKTNILLAEADDATSEHFLVLIDHVEDEVTVDGKVLAERDIRVALQFDVIENQQVLLNGVPVTMGYSELQVSAQIFEVDSEGITSPFDTVVSLTVRLFVGLRMVQMEDGTQVTGVYIQERVIAIQASEVWQAEVQEQVFVVRANGEVKRVGVYKVAVLQGEPQPKEDNDEVAEKPHHHKEGGKHHGGHKQGHMEEHEHEHEHNHDENVVVSDSASNSDETEQDAPHHPHGKCQIRKYIHRFVRWFHSLPFYQRLLVSFGIGVALGFVGLALISCIRRVLACLCCSSSKKGNKIDQEEEYKKNIHLYSLQYTAVPQDEKEPKKVQEIA